MKRFLLAFGVAVMLLPLYAQSTYTISTVADLVTLADDCDAQNGYVGATITLTADLDLEGALFRPIGSVLHPFQGKFEGNNHIISGLGKLRGTDGVGLFGVIGANGEVSHLGIGFGQILASGKRRVGALAGINNGAISSCWSMAEIQVAGSVVGGLVGENTGSMTNVYCVGLILQASDTIGVLVGRNSGTITNAYTAGYARNGNAFVGVDANGTYVQCYTDRQLYYQEPGFVGTGMQPLDNTTLLFSLFQSNSAWVNNDGLYPMLAGFEATDAAKLSVTPMMVASATQQPIPHADDLFQTMTLSTLNGVSWSCLETYGEAYIHISGNQATVTAPCEETDVLLKSVLNDAQMVHFTHPRRVEDFLPGTFTAKNDAPTGWCLGSSFSVATYMQATAPTEGSTPNNYHILVVMDSISLAGDTVRMDTLLDDATSAAFQAWMSTATVLVDKPGHYFIRRYAHDEGCVEDWVMSPAGYEYVAFAEFDAGSIVSGADTVYEASFTVNVANEQEAVGGDGVIGYEWNMEDVRQGKTTKLPGYTDASLTGYVVTIPGEYVFTRSAYDGTCQSIPDGSNGLYRLVMREPFDAGDVINRLPDPILCCDVEDALALTINATTAKGGTETYLYQWYMVTFTKDTLPLAGATAQNLVLSTLTETLSAGETYMFIRMAKDDSHFTDWTWSDYSQSVQIFSPFTTGQIENKTLDDYCVMDGGTAAIHMTIQSLSAASGVGSFEYRWLRCKVGGTDTVTIGSDPFLDVTFSSSDIELGETYAYLREVRNATCGSDWQRSAGTVYQTYTFNEHIDSTVVVCETNLPLTVMYPDPENGPFFHKFTYDGETYKFSDLTQGYQCYPTMTMTVETKEAPAIKVDSLALLCQDEGTITIYYEVLKGCPDSFYIELSPSLSRYFENQKHIEGVIDNPVCEGETGAIVLRDVKRIGMGTNYMYVQVGARAGASEDYVCFSMMQYMELEVNLGGYVYPKYNKVLIVDNAPDNQDRLTFTAYQWYKNGVRQEGQTGQYYEEDGAVLNGTYYVEFTANENGTLVNYKSCEIQMPNEPVQEHYNSEAQAAPRLCIDHNRVVIQMVDGQQIDMLGRTVK